MPDLKGVFCATQEEMAAMHEAETEYKEVLRKVEKEASTQDTFPWNEFADDVHKNAESHGWWSDSKGNHIERSYPELIALANSELSEALEEYRDGHEAFYFGCAEYAKKHTECSECIDNCEECSDRKPEGVCVELADCVIRILDTCKSMGIDIEKAMRPPIDLCMRASREYKLGKSANKPLPDVVAYCQRDLTDSMDTVTALRPSNFAQCILRIKEYCTRVGVNLYDVMKLKHEYNKTRPYRHGGKVC